MSEGAYYYQFRAGSRSWRRWGLDDRKARRLLARWIRARWAKHCEEIHVKHPGSMSDAEDNAWYGAPEAGISRIWCPIAGIVPCKDATVIERFELSPEPIREFIRVWGKGVRT